MRNLYSFSWTNPENMFTKHVSNMRMPYSQDHFLDTLKQMAAWLYDSRNVDSFLIFRPGEGGTAEPIKLATVRFHSRTQAMNAYIAKNGTFCQNSRISIQVLQ